MDTRGARMVQCSALMHKLLAILPQCIMLASYREPHPVLDLWYRDCTQLVEQLLVLVLLVRGHATGGGLPLKL